MSASQYVDKPLPALTLAQLTDEVDDMSRLGERVGPLFGRVFAAVAEAGAAPGGAPVAWYEVGEAGVRLGVGVPAGMVPGLETFTLEARPRAVTTVHRGSPDGLSRAWQDLLRHVAESGLQPVGPSREVYLASPEDDAEAWEMELQQPVR